MKNSLHKLIKWFCSKISFNELASAVIIFNEILNGRKDFPLKKQNKSINYRVFKTDPLSPITKPNITIKKNWQEIKQNTEIKTGKIITPINRKNNNLPIEIKCKCCDAPAKYLYINNGKKNSQVKCKICGKTSSTNKVRKETKAKYFCPYCSNALYKWKQSKITTTYKCNNHNCPVYLKNKSKLTKQEIEVRNKQKYNPNFKLHYQYKEYHLSEQDLKTKRIQDSNIRLDSIRNSYHTLGLILTFAVNLGLSSRLTSLALKDMFGINISHQTIINYLNASAYILSPFIDKNCPTPKTTSVADETYIIVEGKWRYTWFIIDPETRAICGYNLSTHRDAVPAIALLYNCFGKPEQIKGEIKMITDGNPSYDLAVMAYNNKIQNNQNKIDKKTVIGLKNLDQESKEYRQFKQIIERLNRTYKYHTRPRAGFKSFDGAVCLTTLFVGFYNFLRPHTYINNNVPVNLDCLNNLDLMPDKWLTLIKQAAA